MPRKIIAILVDGVIMPPIGLLRGIINFEYVKGARQTKGHASLAGAKAKGIPAIAYGQFTNGIINFIIVGFVVFLTVRKVNK